MGSWKGRGNQYMQFVRVLYCKLLTNGKQLPAFPLELELSQKTSKTKNSHKSLNSRLLVYQEGE